MPLVKQVDGSFELTVPLPKDKEILYKYVVDGEWLVNGAESKGNDENGIENNVLSVSALSALAAEGSKIPEAAGLPVITPGTVNTTVMPKEELKQTTLGEPGIFVPKDPEALAAFETVRDVDPKTLNEPELTPEEKQKQKKKLKRTQYKARQKQKKAAAAAAAAGGAAAADGVAATSETESSPSPENAEGVFSSEVEPETTNDEGLPADKQAEAEAAAIAATTATAATTTSEPIKAPEPTPAAEPVTVPVSEPVPEPATEPGVAPTDESFKVSPETLDPAVVGAVAPGTTHQDAEETTEDPVAVAAAMAASTEEPIPVKETEEAAKEVDALPVSKPAEEDDIIVAEGGKSAQEVSKLIASATGKEVEQISPSAEEAKNLTEQAKKTKANVPTTAPSSNGAKNTAKGETKEKKKGFFSKLKKIFK